MCSHKKRRQAVSIYVLLLNKENCAVLLKLNQQPTSSFFWPLPPGVTTGHHQSPCLLNCHTSYLHVLFYHIHKSTLGFFSSSPRPLHHYVFISERLHLHCDSAQFHPGHSQGRIHHLCFFYLQLSLLSFGQQCCL